MKPQNWEIKRRKIVHAFQALLAKKPELTRRRLKLSWSNWGFGIEPLSASAERLARHGIEWIELHGNRYGTDLGYRPREARAVLESCGVRTAGICGMFSAENDLSSNSGVTRQRAIDYIRRQLELCHDLGGSYLLVVPGAVGRPQPYDASEFDRSVETLRIVADDFVQAGVRGAVEPIRAAEVSLIHTFAEARRYLAAVNHPGIRHINGDIYHMLVGEANIAETLAGAGNLVINLHMADTNRCALGAGSMDLDAILMALYLTGYTEGERFATPEPLGPGGDPYPAMFGKPDPTALDRLVGDTARYFRQREQAIKALPRRAGA